MINGLEQARQMIPRQTRHLLLLETCILLDTKVTLDGDPVDFRNCTWCGPRQSRVISRPHYPTASVRSLIQWHHMPMNVYWMLISSWNIMKDHEGLSSFLSSKNSRRAKVNKKCGLDHNTLCT